MRIGFVGLGKLGLPVAEAMAAVHDVVGYDVRKVASDVIGIASDMEALAEASDVIFIAVQTPHDPLYDGSSPTTDLESKDFDYGIAAGVLDRLSEIGVEGKTVVLISTVLPGTIRGQLAPRLSGADLIYNPYLIAMGTVARDFANPEMIMIGNGTGEVDAHVRLLMELYRPLMENDPRVVTGTWEEMESTKIFYNTFISAKLSLVNMMQDVAERVGHMDVDVVAKALADSTQRITGPAYMRPGMGDGGPCHPRDNIALSRLSETLHLGYDLFDAIMHAREMQARNLAAELARHRLPVFILGKSFKPGVPYTDGSYGMLVGWYCEIMCGRRVTYDAIATNPAVYLLAHDVDYSKNIARMYKGSVIVDPWRRAVAPSGIEVIHWGNSRGRSGAR